VHLPEETLHLREEGGVAVVKGDGFDVVGGGGTGHEQRHHLRREDGRVHVEHGVTDSGVGQTKLSERDGDVVEALLVEKGEGARLEHAADGTHLSPDALRLRQLLDDLDAREE